MTGSCSGKVAIVTGGAMGIGRAISEALHREGASVIIADVNAEAATATRDAIRSDDGKAWFVHCDVADTESVEAAIAAAVATCGRVDCIVNNAGLGGPNTEICDIAEATFDRIMAINVKGVFLFHKYGIRQMRQQDTGGAIVNIASVGGVVGTPMLTPYTMSKHAVIGLTRGTAVEQSQHGIRVNAVCPGPIHTAMFEEYAERQGLTLEELGAPLPIRRIGQPQEVAEAVVWLCSDRSSNTTGSLIMVDGGYTAQ